MTKVTSQTQFLSSNEEVMEQSVLTNILKYTRRVASQCRKSFLISKPQTNVLGRGDLKRSSNAALPNLFTFMTSYVVFLRVRGSDERYVFLET